MTETSNPPPATVTDPRLQKELQQRLDREAGRGGKFFSPDRLKAALPLILVLAFGILYPLLADNEGSLQIRGWPAVGEFFPHTASCVTILVFTMMAVGLNVVVGYAGLLDLGYVAFYAAGAYVAGWFASQQFDQVSVHFGAVGVSPTLPGIHISIWPILLLAGIFTGVVGILIGLPTLRLRGDYLAIVTLGFGEIVPQVVRNADSVGGFDLTHGTFGITPIDSPGFGEGLSNATGGFLPVAFSRSFDKDNLYYWTALSLLLVTIYCCWRLRDSRLGRAWIAIREDETAAAAMGVPLMRTKTWAYAIGAFFGGIAGAFYASSKSGAFPSDFYFNISIFLLCMVILGGMGSIWGVVVAGVLLGWLNFEGLAVIGTKLNHNVFNPLGTSIDVPKYQFGIYGVILVTMMLFRPTGLIPERRRKLEMEEGVHDEAVHGELHGIGTHRGTWDARLMAAPILLDAAAVRKEFGGLVAVNDVDFTIPEKSIVSLIGPNGAGKTTFFNMLTGVYKPTAGVILFDGVDVSDKPPHAITKLGVGRTFQNIRLFQQMTSIENVLVGMHARMKGGILGAVFRLPAVKREERDAYQRARELLRFCGLRGRDNELSRNLSYGDQRRLEVARALATEPKLLLLDEPTAGMNPQETADFTSFVVQLRDERDLTVLMIEHDMKVIMSISDRVTVLDYGEKIAEGTPGEIQTDQRVIEAYLGKAAVGGSAA